MLEFWVIDDGHPAPPQTIDQSLIRIGRNPANDVVLSAPYVSSRHGQVRLSASGEAVYEDLGARNGTYLRRDGTVKPLPGQGGRIVELLDGDELLFGKPELGTSIRVRQVDQGVARESAEQLDTGLVMVLTKLDVTDAGRIEALSASLDRDALLALLDYGARVAGQSSRDEILKAFCDALLGLFNKATHVSIYLGDLDDSAPGQTLTRTRRGDAGPARLSRTLRDAVSEQGQAVTFTIEDPLFDSAESLKRASVHAGICAPLWTGKRMAGLVQVDGRSPRQVPFDDHDLEVVAVFANQLAIAVENTHLHEQLEETIVNLRGTQMELERLAFTDSLTGLSNRQLLQDRLDQTVKLAARQHNEALLIIIDLDGFKRVNDTYGHAGGDELLAQVGERLQRCLRGQDTVARIGGDEFAAIVYDVSGQAGAAVVAEKLLDAIREPLRVAGQSIVISASLGLTLAPADGTDVSALLRNADLAMYRAKSLGRDRFNFFTEEMNREASRRLRLENELRAGLDEGQFLACYQPVVNVMDSAVLGFEGLVRWQHPERGLIMPDDFIDVAEQSGLIVPLGEWMLRSGCHAARRLLEEGRGRFRVSVNLSARQFAEPALPELVESVLHETALDPAQLELEITESMIMGDTEQAFERLERVKRLGVSLCVDDFGTGYSSLAYLKRLPVDSLKIDRSFVDGIPLDTSDVEITAAVIAMAHKLKLRVVAEGISTEAQFEFLRVNGCDEAQGYLFGEARPIEALDALLQARG